ncbi:MAG: transglutaminase domain protein [Frankiales bacterium]|nr:transglutaminase domain protein [Frankiales bacterium]
MSTRDRLTLASALAVALACSALDPLYEDHRWAAPALGVVLLVALVGGLGRRLGLPALVLPVVQALAVLEYVAVGYARSTLAAGLPTPSTVRALNELLLQASDDIDALAVPVPGRTPLVLVAVLAAAAVALAVDLVAAGLQRPAVAGLPLLVLLAVPSGLLPGGLGWLPFTLGAAGWLGLLLVEGGDRVSRWGVPLRPGPSSSDGIEEAGSTGRVGRRVGVAALGLAAFVPALVPGLDARLLPGTGPTGDAAATGPRASITYNPITELQGQLTLPDARTLLRYTTSDTDPDYLRMTTLDVFDGSQWRSSSLVPDDDTDGGLPAPEGVAETTASYPVRTRVEVAALEAQWLPLPPVASSVDVPGPWRWNARSQTVFATRSNTLRAKEWSATSTRVTPDRSTLEAAGSTVPKGLQAYAKAPSVTGPVKALTRKVTSSADTPYEAAVALQRFFRNPAEGFSYDEKTRNPFDNPDALAAFLENRQGFCEQYASAMAAMLRVLGIPARVAVGFTPGREQPDGSRVVTTDDAHAWPEAWFAGAGWIRFEPTPVDDDREIVPTYTQEQDAAQPAPSAPAATASAAPGAPAPAGKDPGSIDPQDAEPLADPSAGSGSDSGLPSGRVLALLLVLVLAAVPAALALVRRRLRARSDDVLAGWAQLQDDAADVGHRWRPADSPRAAALRVGEELVLPTDAREALQRLAAGAERARYARAGGAPGGAWQADVALVRRALLRAVTGRRRARALLAPPSTLQQVSSTGARWTADLLDRVDDTVGALGRRLRPGRSAG